MPLYSYYCIACLKTYEITIPLSRYGEKVKCPHCKRILKKAITPVYLKR